MLLVTQTISKATASSTQRTCRFCSPAISANCTDERGILHCHINFSSCPRKNCSDDDIFCSYNFNNNSSPENWYFSSDCSSNKVNPPFNCVEHDTLWFCFGGVSIENGYDPEVVEYQADFNYTIRTEREWECNETCLYGYPMSRSPFKKKPG